MMQHAHAAAVRVCPGSAPQDEVGNPIKQDIKKGKLRFYPYNINWNYGLLPQVPLCGKLEWHTTLQADDAGALSAW